MNITTRECDTRHEGLEKVLKNIELKQDTHNSQIDELLSFKNKIILISSILAVIGGGFGGTVSFILTFFKPVILKILGYI